MYQGLGFAYSEPGSCPRYLPVLYCQSENDSEYANLGKAFVRACAGGPRQFWAGAPPIEGVPPVIQVRRTGEANSTAVVGVVASTYSDAWLADPAKIDATGATGPDRAIPQAGPGPIAPGEYLLVVVQGPAQVKASALSAAIQPGDLLSSAGEAGYAARAAEMSIDGVTIAAPGTVFGKALEELREGQGLLYVYVTLQ
jgi:hypothetical protein